MPFTASVRPITVGDDILREHLRSAEIPALLMTVAQLTGDLSILRDDCRPSGWFFLPQGGLSVEQQEEARELALCALRRIRCGESIPPLCPDVLRTITSWAMGIDTEELLPLLVQEIALTEEDPKAPGWTQDDLAPGADVRVAIIGAGMSGLLAAYRLSQAGVPFVIYEKNSEVGGTWFENIYPGCRVDVASHLYSYSFATRTDWPDHFCTQDVLLDYFRKVAKDFELLDHIRFNTEVTAMEWDESHSQWVLTVCGPDGQQTAKHGILISAVGQLNRPKFPDIPGRAKHTGPAFHSARWDHSVELTGRRVAVIGTGASAYQFIPEIAKDVGELLVFQRTPPWLRPTPHYHEPVSDSAMWLYEHVPYYAQWQRFWLFAPGLWGVLEGWVVDPQYPPTERSVSAVNDDIRAMLTQGIEAQLTEDPELLGQVLPSYPVGAKRVLRDNGIWLETLKRDNVRLITEPIKEITSRGVVTVDDTEHDADVLIYGTGFQASRFLMSIKVTGRSGIDLHDMWDGDPRAYLGITIPGFPNLFCLYGPNTNLVGQGGSIIYFSECAVTYIVDAIRLLLETGCRAMDVRNDVHDDYNTWIDEGNANRAWGWSTVSSWYNNDKGRSPQNWPFTAQEYWQRTRRIDGSAYEMW